MKVSDYIAEYIAKTGVDTVFGYQGSNIAHLIDSISCNKRLKYIQNYHEQGSSFSACGYALTTGKTGVAVASSGPGVTNMIGGIANAFFDSIPCVFLSGQLSTNSLNTNSFIRQNGFQEMDICSVVSPISKYAVRITNPNDVPYVIEKAFFIANHMRKGPSVIDLPHNIQGSHIEPEVCRHFIDSDEYFSLIDHSLNIEDKALSDTCRFIQSSKRPLVLLGHGICSLANSELLLNFIKRINAPVCMSMLGLSAVHSDEDFNLGMIGSYGERAANIAAASCDLLIVLGSRIDPHQYGGDNTFAKYAKIIHVDLDKHVLNHSIREDVSINSTCEEFLCKISDYPIDRIDKKWLQQLIKIKTRFQSETNSSALQSPVKFVNNITKMLDPYSVICTDVGQNLIWAARGTEIKTGTHLLCSGGYGSMGFAIPAAIGSSYSDAHIVIAFVGDGGVQMNIQELGVITRENLPVITVVFKNDCLGMIRSYQKKVLGRYPGSIDGFSSPNFEMIAQAYGMDYYVIPIDKPELMQKAIKEKRPALAVVNVDQNMDLAPEPAYGKPIYNQMPFLDDYDADSYLEELLGLS